MHLISFSVFTASSGCESPSFAGGAEWPFGHAGLRRPRFRLKRCLRSFNFTEFLSRIAPTLLEISHRVDSLSGMATQYLVTGRAVGFADDKQPFSFIQGQWPQGLRTAAD